jgi:serine protease inhibitor
MAPKIREDDFYPRQTILRHQGLKVTNFSRIEVSMMAGRFKLPLGYSKELECRVLELPFSQRRISMFLLLPDESVDGLSRLEANISTENIKLLFSTLQVSILKAHAEQLKK